MSPNVIMGPTNNFSTRGVTGKTTIFYSWAYVKFEQYHVFIYDKRRNLINDIVDISQGS